MRKTPSLITFLLLVCTIVPLVGAQTGLTQIRDSVKVYTDRSLYISGESIQFSAFAVELEEMHTGPVSRILYIELISPSGIKHSAAKFFTEGSRWSGSLAIPSNLITGLYYLKSYTKMMRNTGPLAYSYIPLRIINPTRPEVLNNHNESAGNFPPVIESKQEVSLPVQVTIECFDSIDETRDSILVRISAGALGREKATCCLSVVPVESGTNYLGEIKPSVDNMHTTTGFLPESRGLSLSGMVNDQTSGRPISLDRVHLSIMGQVKDYLSVMTDSEGRFYFPLPPLEGKRDIFIFAEDKDGKQARIQVDNDFCTERLMLPAAPFGLSEQEGNRALELARNEQIIRNYNLPEKIPSEISTIDTLSFYGSPTSIINLDKYIQLPSLEEYINEFLPEVRIRKQDGKKHFMIFGANSELSIYPPLVLIDWIAVPEASKILAIPPERISRIEIVNTPYIKGDMIYGGIVSIVSRRHDFAGIDLTSSGLFIRFLFLENSKPEATGLTKSSNIPDVRNTLYWNPYVILTPGKPLEYKVSLPDNHGKFRIICRGFSISGKELYGSCDYTFVRLHKSR
jgi:hypothetical protein